MLNSDLMYKCLFIITAILTLGGCTQGFENQFHGTWYAEWTDACDISYDLWSLNEDDIQPSEIFLVQSMYPDGTLSSYWEAPLGTYAPDSIVFESADGPMFFYLNKLSQWEIASGTWTATADSLIFTNRYYNAVIDSTITRPLHFSSTFLTDDIFATNSLNDSIFYGPLYSQAVIYYSYP